MAWLCQACLFALDPTRKAGEPNTSCESHVHWAFSHAAEDGFQEKEGGLSQAVAEWESQHCLTPLINQGRGFLPAHLMPMSSAVQEAAWTVANSIGSCP